MIVEKKYIYIFTSTILLFNLFSNKNLKHLLKSELYLFHFSSVPMLNFCLIINIET